MTNEGLTEVIVFLEGAYRTEFTKEQVKAWEKALDRYDDEQVMVAAEEWIGKGEHFPPNCADLCRLTKEIEEQEREDMIEMNRRARLKPGEMTERMWNEIFARRD